METVFKGYLGNRPKAANKRALLVIDVQNDYFGGPLAVCHPEGSADRIVRAIEAAQKAAIPVVFVQHSAAADAKLFAAGSHGWRLHERIAVFTPDLLIEKSLPSAFVNTPLDGWLRQKGIDSVVITGYMTQNCCDATARYAAHLGYAVEFLSDATATLGLENDAGKVSAEALHRAVLVAQAARFSRVMTTGEWSECVRNG